MSRFDIYRNPGKNQHVIPYLLDLQSNVISGLGTRIVVPLRPVATFAGLPLPPDLFPIILVEGKDYALDMPQLAAVPLSLLTEFVVSARSYQFDIQTALDRLFGAY